MALCLAESLLEQGAFDPVDQLHRYVRWYREGHLSATGHCFDIGNTVRSALHEFERTGKPRCGSTNPHSAGNGSIMRLAPVPMRYAREPSEAIARSAESSRTTHGAVEAVDACRYLAGLLVGLLTGRSKVEVLTPGFEPCPDCWRDRPLAPRIAEVAAGSFRRKSPPVIRGTGYVVASLEAALWAFAGTNSFQDAALQAVNLGDDADTTGAVLGQLAGAYYGESAIPGRWLEHLAMRELIGSDADRLGAAAWEKTTGMTGDGTKVSRGVAF